MAERKSVSGMFFPHWNAESLFLFFIIFLICFSPFVLATDRYVYPQQQYQQQSLEGGLSLNFAGAGIQYPHIQAAIDDACDGDVIYLAAGRFKGFGNRDLDFKGKAITVSSLDPNNPAVVAATIIDCNGTQAEPHRGFYFHNNEDANSIVDGFTITNGYAGYATQGGGIYCLESSPTITNCNISHNFGSGIYCELGNLKIVNSMIAMNNVYAAGGGIECFKSTLTIANSTVTDNKSTLGGGICLDRSNATITDCVISRNRSDSAGGGVFCDEGELIITNSTVFGNSAVEGGGICGGGGKNTMKIVNCVVAENSAGHSGGLTNCNGSISNCTITGNKASYGGGLDKCVCLASNCIIWDNFPQQIEDFYDTTSVIYSDVGGGWPGIGNIDEDPLFVDAGYWDSNGTPDDANDDFWVDGDYHLKSAGWRWDADANQWTWDDVTSRCIDAGNPGWPLGDEPLTLDVDPLNRWGENLRIDMGCFGRTGEASMPPYDWALLSDMDNSGKVNFADYSYLADYYGQEGEKLSGDLNRDGRVDIEDISLIAADWLKHTDWAAW